MAAESATGKGQETEQQPVGGASATAAAAIVVGLVAYAVVEGLGEYGLLGVAGCIALFALICIYLAARSAVRGDYGSAVAWQLMALPIISLLIVLALPAIHPSNLLGSDNCDPVTGVCDEGRAPPGNWLPLVLFVAAFWATMHAQRRSRRNGRLAAP